MIDKKFAIIIDECHSSTKGSYMSNVGKVLSQEEAMAFSEDSDEDLINEIIERDLKRSKKQQHITLLGFSATPKKKTLELFGTKIQDGDNARSTPFTVYSMQQAVEEGFILDVLKHYTTYKTYFKTNKKIEDNPKFKKTKMHKAVIKYAMLQPENIEQKAEIIETANEMSREISKGTKDYADSILLNIETTLEQALQTIQNNRRELK